MGGKQWKPQRARSGTSQMKASSPSSSDAYLPPAFTRTHGEINPPSVLGPPRVYLTLSHNCGQTGSQQRGPVASQTPTFLCRYRLCVARLPKSRAEIMQTLCSSVGIFCHCSLSPCPCFFYFICERRCKTKLHGRAVSNRGFFLYLHFWFTCRQITV